MVLLAGGTGGAKLARGMLDEVGSDLVVIANTGDDVEAHGGYVSPDPDLVLYWLADRIDPRGWGIEGNTFAARVIERFHLDRPPYGYNPQTFVSEVLSAEEIRNTDLLRIRLRLSDTPELAELPWEFLYDQTRNRFLGLSDRTPLMVMLLSL